MVRSADLKLPRLPIPGIGRASERRPDKTRCLRGRVPSLLPVSQAQVSPLPDCSALDSRVDRPGRRRQATVPRLIQVALLAAALVTTLRAIALPVAGRQVTV